MLSRSLLILLVFLSAVDSFGASFVDPSHGMPNGYDLQQVPYGYGQQQYSSPYGYSQPQQYSPAYGYAPQYPQAYPGYGQQGQRRHSMRHRHGGNQGCGQGQNQGQYGGGYSGHGGFSMNLSFGSGIQMF